MDIVQIPKFNRRDLVKSAKQKIAEANGAKFKMPPIPFVRIRCFFKADYNTIRINDRGAQANIYLLLAEATKPKPKKHGNKSRN